MGNLQDELDGQERKAQILREERAEQRRRERAEMDRAFEMTSAKMQLKSDDEGMELHWRRRMERTEGVSQVESTGMISVVLGLIALFVAMLSSWTPLYVAIGSVAFVGALLFIGATMEHPSPIFLRIEGDVCVLQSQVYWMEAGNLGFLRGWWHTQRILFRRQELEMSIHRDEEGGLARACISVSDDRIFAEPRYLSAQDVELIKKFCSEAGVRLQGDIL